MQDEKDLACLRAGRDGNKETSPGGAVMAMWRGAGETWRHNHRWTIQAYRPVYLASPGFAKRRVVRLGVQASACLNYTLKIIDDGPIAFAPTIIGGREKIR